MNYATLVMATLLLAGCAAPSYLARSDGPLKTLNREKAGAEVAQCIQAAWQDVKLLGDSADEFMDRHSHGNLTVSPTTTR